MTIINLDDTYKHIRNLIERIDINHPLQSHHYMIIEDKDFKGTILDVGSGCCEFAIVAKLTKPEISMNCVDMNYFVATLGKFLSVKAKVPITVYAKEVVTNKKRMFKDNTFDVVVLSHVAEHIKDLDKLFKWVNKILKIDGIIYLAFPYMDAHDSPEHKHYFSNKSGIIINSRFNGMQECIHINEYLKKYNYVSKILIFDEEKADKRHPHKSHGQLDYYIKIKFKGGKK